MEKENSFAMEILKELSNQNKLLLESNDKLLQSNNKSSKNYTVIIIVTVSLWFSTVMGFGWYLNQYDYTSETYEETYSQDGEGYNNIGGDLNVTDSKEEENNQEKD